MAGLLPAHRVREDIWRRRDRDGPLDAWSLHVRVADEDLARLIEEGDHGI